MTVKITRHMSAKVIQDTVDALENRIDEFLGTHVGDKIVSLECHPDENHQMTVVILYEICLSDGSDEFAYEDDYDE